MAHRSLIFCFAALVLSACGGSLSDEQRRKLREGMEDHKIVQLSDSEIVSAALEEGRSVYADLEKAGFAPEKIGGISRQHQARARYLKPGTDNALEVESEIIQAYIVGAGTGATQDNIQKVYHDGTNDPAAYDSLLYSRPVVRPVPDGSVTVEGVWNIYLSKRAIVRSLSKK